MKKREDEFLEQMEELLKEAKESMQEAATSAAVEHKQSFFSFRQFLKLGFNNWGTKISFILICVILIGTIIGVGASNLFSGPKSETEKGSFIEQVKELSSLATAQAFVKAVIEKEDNELFGKQIKANIPGTKRKLLLIVPGTVTAGVDLKNLKAEDVVINEEQRTMKITLPHAEILQEPSLDFDQVKTFSVEGIFRNEVDWEEAYDLAEEAKDAVKEEALAQGLLKMAEKNAEKTLKEFFQQMGYEVTVQFEE